MDALPIEIRNLILYFVDKKYRFVLGFVNICMFKYIKKIGFISAHNTEHIMHRFIKNGHLSLVQWFIVTARKDVSDLMIDASIRYDQLDILRWLITKKNTYIIDYFIGLAVTNNHLHILQFLCEKYPPEELTELLMFAKKHQRLDMVKWITSHFDV